MEHSEFSRTSGPGCFRDNQGPKCHPNPARTQHFQVGQEGREVLSGRVGGGEENSPSFGPWAWLLLTFYPFVVWFLPAAPALVFGVSLTWADGATMVLANLDPGQRQEAGPACARPLAP